MEVLFLFSGKRVIWTSIKEGRTATGCLPPLPAIHSAASFHPLSCWAGRISEFTEQEPGLSQSSTSPKASWERKRAVLLSLRRLCLPACCMGHRRAAESTFDETSKQRTHICPACLPFDRATGLTTSLTQNHPHSRYTYAHTYTQRDMQVHIHTLHIYRYVHTCAHIYTHICTHTYRETCKNIYICTSHIHIYMHI